MLKRGISLPDGTPREEFCRLPKGIHERLIEQLNNEGSPKP